MNTPEIEVKRERLRSLYRSQIKLNKEKKTLEEELMKREASTGVREKVARKRKKDPRLPVSIIAQVLGCSRDRVYRLLQLGKIVDRHPVSVGKYARIAGQRDIPRTHEEKYQKWCQEYRSWRHQRKSAVCKYNQRKSVAGEEPTAGKMS